MKPAPFRYERPATVDEALAALAGAGDEGRVLAGGQSLVPMLNLRLSAPAVVVDINRVAGLAGIDVADGWLTVGAMVRQRAAERSVPVRRACPLLAACLPLVGHVATRNRGTVGGSIAHADPAAELPLALVAAGGDVDVAGPSGRRRVSAADLFTGFLATSLEPGELIVSCRFPLQAEGAGSAFLEASPRAGDFAYAAVAATVSTAGGAVTGARFAVGAVADRPVLVEAAGAAAEGAPAGDPDAARAVAFAVRDAVEPSGSLHASADYQRHLLGVLAERACNRAMAEAAAR